MATEHLIRLRGAWDWHLPGASGPRRISLPTTWPTGLIAPFRLTRRFGRPPIDPGGPAWALRIESAPGLVAARLNGRLLDRAEAGSDGRAVELSVALADRNLLELEVDPAGWAGARTGEAPWGSFALVVRPA